MDDFGANFSGSQSLLKDVSLNGTLKTVNIVKEEDTVADNDEYWDEEYYEEDEEEEEEKQIKRVPVVPAQSKAKTKA